MFDLVKIRFNIWQTWATLVDKKRATHEDLIHIMDNVRGGAHTYTIRFTPKPAATLNIISVKLNGMENNNDVSVSNAEVKSVEVNFTADIRQLLPKALSLVNQGEVVDMTDVDYVIDGQKLTIDLSRVAHNDGFYCLTVNTALIVDADGHVGLTATPISWIEQTDKPVQLNLAYNFKGAATVTVLAEEYHGVKTVYDTPVTPAAAYKYGTTLTLKVTPAYGYLFNRWSIDGNILSTEPTYDYYLYEQFYRVYRDLWLEEPSGIPSQDGNIMEEILKSITETLGQQEKVAVYTNVEGGLGFLTGYSKVSVTFPKP